MMNLQSLMSLLGKPQQGRATPANTPDQPIAGVLPRPSTPSGSQEQPKQHGLNGALSFAEQALGVGQPQQQQPQRGLNGALSFAERLGSDIGGALGLGAPAAAAPTAAAGASGAAAGGGIAKLLASLFV